MTNKHLFSLKMLGVIFALFLTIGSAAAQTPVSKNGQLKVVGLKLCNQFGNPIQLRGMSTHGIQWYGWGDCLTNASLDALANDWGGDILRISMYVQEGGYETNPTAFTNQVNTLIEAATARGMYALVDFHQLTPGDPNANLQNAKNFFTSIANTHKNKNNILYDICNEPNGVAWSRIKTYADQIIPVIRAIDGDAPILVGTHGWGSMGISDGRTAQDIVSAPVNATNIMYTFHFYAASHGDQYYNELNWASDRLPVFVTEFGTQTASGDGTNNFTMSQKYIDLMRTKKISWCNWNFSDDERTGAVWTSGTCSNGPWNTTRLKPAGLWVRERMLSPADDFPGGTVNQAPTVSLTSPSNNASFTAPASITISANAADADGTVSKVEFYNGTTLLNSDNAAPFTFNWTNVGVGTYTITAKATDNANASTTSNAVTVTVTAAPVTQGPYQGVINTIPGTVQAERYDVGGQGVAFNDVTASNEGGAFRATEAVDIESIAGGGFNVGWIVANEWLEYTTNVTAGTYKIDARVAAESAGKSFRVELDGATIATFTVPNTGGWQNWQTVSVNNVTVTGGQKVLRIFATAGDFNLDNLVFSIVNNQNQAPTINLTSPSNNSSSIAPASITIAANAADADGTISKVEFYKGSTLLNTDNSSPYSFVWTNVSAGSYVITAKATDNAGAATTSSAVTVTVNVPNNQAPTVNLTSPSNNSSSIAPASITIAANAADADGTISKVEFYNGGTLLNTDNSSPYSFVWTNVSAGSYVITAKATDNAGAATTSSAVTITVTTPNNQAPTVSLTAPTNNANYNAPASITISANAADADGSVSKVDFYNGTSLVGSDASAPYSFTWTSVAAGTYTITARAADNAGAVTTSSAVTVKVNPVATDGCSGVGSYVENSGYVAGSKAKNGGSQYQCKEWPFSGWCNGAAWAYAPGTGIYWMDAWTLIGSCTARVGQTAEINDQLLSNSPNPFDVTTTLEVTLAESGPVSIQIFDKTGQLVNTVMEGNLNAGTHQFNYDASSLNPGMYVVKCNTVTGTVTRKIVKIQ